MINDNQKERRKQLRIGLTGGMASGKSTVLCLFADAGWRTVDADAVVRGLLMEDEAVIRSVLARYGEGVKAEAGSGIDRRKLAEIVFAEPAELDWLEGLLHPRVRAEWGRVMETEAERPVIVEIPLLFEKNLENAFDFIVCIETSLGTQLSRMKQRGMSREMAMRRIARQLPMEEKVRRAHYVVSNNGTKEFLNTQVSRLLARLENPARGE